MRSGHQRVGYTFKLTPKEMYSAHKTQGEAADSGNRDWGECKSL